MKIRKLGCLLLALALCLGITACGGDVEPTTDPADPTVPSTAAPTKPRELTYTVSVKADNGKALSGVGVWIYTDSSMTEMIWFDKTNADGVMSFVAKESGSYVLALQNVPEGYEVAASYPVTEQTDIVLKTVIQSGGEIGKQKLNLGDVMVDFSVTTVDGATLRFADMLASGRTVVLNFFYNECSPCRSEFPYLQKAYAQYASDVVVVAMNPINTDENAIKALAADLGLTFPMAVCEYGWEAAFDLQAYPTTVVIDKFGVISLIHRGAVTEEGVFEDVFAFFCADGYTQQVVENIEDIVSLEVEGTKEYPFVLGSIQEFDGNVPVGGVQYYQLYKVSGMVLEIKNENLWVEYNGEKHYPENGVISLLVTSPDTNTPVEIAIGNNGAYAEEFHADLTFPLGTGGNPIVLTPGNFTANVEKGNDQGVWYTYVAEKTGTVRLGCLGVTEGTEYMFSLYNTNSYNYITSVFEPLTDPVTGEIYILAEVTAGDFLQITVGTLPDEEYNYPAAQIDMVLTVSEKTGEVPVEPPIDPTEPTEPTEPAAEQVYTVVVVDDKDNAVAGAEVYFFDLDDTVVVVTDGGGLAQFVTTSTEIGFQVVAPGGYEAPEMVYPVLSPDMPVFLVTLQSVETTQPTEPTEPTEPPVEPTEPTEPPAQWEYTELYVGNAYHVSVGDREISLEAGTVNYFLFYPEEGGVYQVSTSDPAAVLSYWGGNIHFITEQTPDNFADNAFTINVKPSMLGQGYILGITGSGSCTLTIQRLGDAILDETDAPWEVYTPKIPIEKVTLEAPADKSLTYVDVTGSCTLVYNEATGFYHLGTADGPVVYVNVKSAPSLSFNALIQNTGLHVYYYDEAGVFQNKVDYTACIADYIKNSNAKGLYPLNDDLIRILQDCVGYYGWADATSPNFLLLGVNGINPEIAWMFTCCYYA